MAIVSVIIPFFNASSFIDNIIECLRIQLFKDFEAIFVDDGSTDDSYKKCFDLISTDSRYILLHQTNQGVSSARNYGLKYATGDYICFADIDDLFNENYIKDLVDYSKGSDLVLQGRYRIKNGKKEHIGVPVVGSFNLIHNADLFFKSVDIEKFGGPYSKLFNRSIISHNNILFSENLSLGEDFDFLVQYLRFCKIVTLSEYSNYYYKDNPGSLTTKIYDYEREYLGLKQIDSSLKALSSIFFSDSLQKLYNKSVSYYIYRCICSLLTNKNRKYRLEKMKDLHLEYGRIYKHFNSHLDLYLKIQKYLFCHKCFIGVDILQQLICFKNKMSI